MSAFQGASRRMLVAALSLPLFLTGCGGDNQDLRDWMREAAKGMKGKVPPLPSVMPTASVSYDAGNLLDPFNPAKIEPEKKGRGGGGLQPDMNRRREPLESFPLETLRMVGTLAKGNAIFALVQADKALYQVRVGNYMGQNFGLVTAISDSEVTLKELVEDANGDWTDRVSTLQLQETGK